MRLVVIADDLTGAAEVAGAALRFGLSAEVQIGQLSLSRADVIVVDADSRALRPCVAFAKVAELTRQAVALEPDLIFKKVDSLLRGPVRAELTAARKLSGCDHCLLVCGNPRKHRTLVDGRIRVAGRPLHETDIALDPEHPRLTDDALELLRQGSFTELAREAIAELDSLAWVGVRESSEAELWVGQVAGTQDLNQHAEYWYSRRRETQAAGGGEFFEALLRALGCSEKSGSAVQVGRNDRGVLLISGTRSSQTDDWPLVRCGALRAVAQSAAEVAETLATYGRAAIRAADIENGTPSQRIDRIVAVADRALASCRPMEVWLEGGRAASAVIRQLRHQRLIAVGDAGDGIAALRAAAQDSPIYLLKPGSYPWSNQTDAALGDSAEVAKEGNVEWSASRKILVPVLLWLLASWALPQVGLAEEVDFERAREIIAAQCLDCHNAQTQEGTVDLERFQSESDLDADRALWKTVFDVVEAGQMPLPQSGYELDDAERRTLLSFARRLLSQPDPKLNAIDPGKPILRRLTRLEYNNTVRDLFALDYDIFMFPERMPVADKRYFTSSSRETGLGDVVQTSMREYGQKYDVLLPQLGLPGDNRAEYGFSNRGDALNFSPLLFEKYLQMAAAIASSERLLQDSRVMQHLLAVEPPQREPTDKPSGAVALIRDFAAPQRIGRQAVENDTWHNSFVSELTAAFERGSGGTFDVPASLNNQSIAGKGGLLKLQVQGDVLLINPNVDLWLASFATADETSGDHLLTNRIKGEKVFELTFEGAGAFEPEIQHLGVCVLARRNQSGPVQLAAVLSNGQRMPRQAVISESSGNVFFSWVAPPGTSIEKLAVDGSGFSGDYVLLDDFGFIFANPAAATLSESKAVSEQSQVVDDRAKASSQPLFERVSEFLSRAYRRPASDSELSSSLALVSQRMQDGDTEVEALRHLIQAVLSSPEFLFLAEPVSDSAESVRQLTPHELATRLSYFLWSSMPDEQLFAAAENGTIQQPEMLRAQIQRLLEDRSRSRELSESFAVQWLRLDQLYSSKPERELFKDFYSGPQGKSTLHGPMMIEALLLFETVLAEDRSVLQLYDANYTWLNGQLATLYGLDKAFHQAHATASESGLIPESLPEKSAGSYWLRTPLPDRNRGGVMTMAGSLTLTSLPFRTSPIKRGAWLLETVFNRPPAEPKVAFVLEEASQQDADAPQSLTVRQLFEKHRSDPNCFSCHSRIDPPGFSLEVFDAMGSYRTHDGQQPVDASGSWNGVQFSNPAEFKDAIRVREPELVRGFVEHMLSYALARELEHFDMCTVEQIVADTAASEYRMSAIIEGIVLSYPFRYTRN
ncbi:MAG: DUF1592 domain-containing protein [bacterium]|nr:DUF1592 domain-containing protein [bacterium]